MPTSVIMYHCTYFCFLSVDVTVSKHVIPSAVV